MDAFMNTEVIAGALLAFYFFARAGFALVDRKNGTQTNGNGKVLEATYKAEMRLKMDNLQKDITALSEMLNIWDDKIHQGDFTSPFSDREAGEMLEILRRIDRNLS